MTSENQQIMLLLKSHILEEDTVKLVPDVDWHRLIEVAKRQNILSMICDKLISMTTELNEEETRQLYLSMMKQVYLNQKKIAKATDMLELMSQNGIKTVVLKGGVVRDLYPVPEWRTMGDIDVLILPSDMKKTQKLFSDNGYEIKGTVHRELDCYKEKNIPWEIKCTLEAEFGESYEKWDNIYFNYAKAWKHNQFMPTSALLFQHIVIHTSKNLLSIGAGVRNLCDIVLCMKKLSDIDYDAVKQTCKNEGVIKAYNALISCAGKYFDVDVSQTGAEIIDDNAVDHIVEYMLSETIYGKRNGDNRLINWTLRQDDEISQWRKVFFPSLKLMKMPYPYLKKYPFLLPAAWIQRAYDAIFKQRIPIGQMLRGAKKSVDFAEEHERYMRELGLK